MIGFEPHYFDLNEDGIPEFYFQEGSGGTVDNTTLNGWEACIYNPDPDYPYTYQDPDIAFDDASIPWGSCFGVYRVFENNVMRYVLRAAMRIQQDGDYYYGWWDGYVEFGTNPQNALLYHTRNLLLHYFQLPFTLWSDQLVLGYRGKRGKHFTNYLSQPRK